MNSISDRSKHIFNDAIVIDHQLGFEVDMPLEFGEKWAIVQRYANAGFNAVTLSLANDETSPERAINYLAKVLHHIESNTEQFILAKSVEDIKRAKRENKLALRLMFQGSNAIGKNVEMVSLFKQLGLSSMILAYNIRNPLGDGVVEQHDAGLSVLGHKWIEEMNRVGMIIDLAHTGYRTSMEAIEASSDPVMISHTAVDTIHPHVRNIKDDQIKAIANKKGLIGIVGLGVLLGDPSANPKKVAQHIDYIAHHVGPQHVVLGIDYLYFANEFNKFMQRQTITHPQAYANVTKTAQTSNSLPPEEVLLIVEELLNMDYTEQEIVGILGGNLLNLMEILETKKVLI